jgi:hypothetical protein
MSFSTPAFSSSDLFAMHKVILNCADSFTEYLNISKEPIRFTDNVVPLKKEFIKFTTLPVNEDLPFKFPRIDFESCPVML